MKKLLLIAILFAACTTEESLAPRNGLPTLAEASADNQRALCPAGRVWNITSVLMWAQNPPYANDFYIRLTPQPGISGQGTQSGTVNCTVKNIGNIPMQYRLTSIGSYINLAVGETKSFNLTISQKACGTEPVVLDKPFYAKVIDCPFGPNGNNIFSYEVKVIGINFPHNYTPVNPTFTGHRTWAAGLCTL